MSEKGWQVAEKKHIHVIVIIKLILYDDILHYVMLCYIIIIIVHYIMLH